MLNKTYVDQNNLVKPKRAWTDSGNGLLYTVIYNFLQGGSYGCMPVTQLWQRDKGVLWRTPANTYGQESHDNYLALAIWLLDTGNKLLAREVLWSAIKKFGFMQNSFKEGDKWKSQMFRFPQVWTVIFAASFTNPVVSFLSKIVMRVLGLFSRANVSDPSGIQLQWLEKYAILSLGDKKPMRKFLSKLPSMDLVMLDYYEAGHPILEGFKEFEKKLNLQ